MKNIKLDKKDNFKTFYAISFAWQLGFLIVIPIGFFLIIGLYIDKLFKTSPLFIIIGVITGFIVTIYEIHNSLIPLIKNNNPDKK